MMANAETDEQRFLRELRRLLAEPDDVPTQGQEPQHRSRNDPSIAATRNLLRACQEAQGIGLHTVAVLESQGEQLDDVGRALDKISADLDSAEGDLSQMRRPLFGLCPWRCRWRKKKYKKDNAQPSQHQDAKRSSKRELPKPGFEPTTTNDESAAESVTARSSTTAADSSTATETVQGVAAAASGRRRGVQDSAGQRPQSPGDADELGTALAGLKGIAQDIGRRLSAHNEQIDNLTASAASSEERIRRASQQADKILREA